MKVTVLIENEAINNLECEHGLSFLIDYKGERYLLDAGSSGAFLQNAKRMGFFLADVHKCILSHGHYDHSGGFVSLFKENAESVLYMMERAVDEYYSASGGMHYIGIPKELKENYKERFVCINQVTRLSEGVYLVPHNTKGLEQIGERAKLYVRKERKEYPDDFSHELSLVFDSDEGLVVFNSCSHGGILNILREVLEVFPGKKIQAFLGGLHMKGKVDGKEICTFSEEEIKSLAKGLKEINVGCIYTGHCTGKIGIELLKKYGENLVQELTTGKVIVL